MKGRKYRVLTMPTFVPFTFMPGQTKCEFLFPGVCVLTGGSISITKDPEKEFKPLSLRFTTTQTDGKKQEVKSYNITEIDKTGTFSAQVLVSAQIHFEIELIGAENVASVMVVLRLSPDVSSLPLDTVEVDTEEKAVL